MGTIKEALTFDDVLMLPSIQIFFHQYKYNLKFNKKINLKSSFFIFSNGYSNRVKMAIAIAKAGGIGVIHRNLNIKNQSKKLKK